MSLFDVMFRFKGRISRRTFWRQGILPLSVGWILCFGFFIYYVADCMNILGSDDCEILPNEFAGMLGILALVWVFVSVWISLAVSCKRLHDLGKSGWWGLLFFIMAPLPLLVLGIFDGQPSANEYGPPPTDEAPAG